MFCFLAAIPFFLRFADALSPHSPASEKVECAKYLLLLGTLLIVSKVSMGIFVAASLATLVLARGKSLLTGPLRGIWISISLCLLLGVSWIARGYLLSGFPVYPAPFGRLDLPWSLPLEQAKAQTQWVAAVARTWKPVESPDAGKWAWVELWAKRSADQSSYLICAILAAAGLLVCFHFLLQKPRGTPGYRPAVCRADGAVHGGRLFRENIATSPGDRRNTRTAHGNPPHHGCLSRLGTTFGRAILEHRNGCGSPLA